MGDCYEITERLRKGLRKEGAGQKRCMYLEEKRVVMESKFEYIA